MSLSRKDKMHLGLHAADHVIRHTDVGRQATAAAIGGTVLAGKAALAAAAVAAPFVAPAALAAGAVYGLCKLLDD
jgi:hypothetical protein